ncbi:MAG: SDR family NAD(P)-dependent oxidoreductase [Deltaproteobacteria bacterium]|nr:SDR family NAD(P)-dependent oxidoreductase [Deltaproteobacteria bacterium]
MTKTCTHLAGSNAVITGATGGIGGAIALALADSGVNLLLTGRDEGKLEELAGRARRFGSEVQIWVAELEEDRGVAALAGRCHQSFDGIDLLVHSMGLFLGGALEQSSVQDLDRQYRVNVRSPFLLTQALLAGVKQRQGQIVFVNSSAGFSPARGGYGAYGATKHALRAIADSLRDEVQTSGVRVLTVFPGRTASAMQAEVHRYEDRPYDPAQWMQPEDVAHATLAALTLPRTAELTDLHVRPRGG